MGSIRTAVIPSGIATPTGPPKILVASRRRSASSVCHNKIVFTSRTHLTARVVAFPARHVRCRVMSNAVIFLLLAHLSLRAPRDRVDASCHSSRVSRSGARAPSLAREQSWNYCRSCQSCQEQPIARARLSSVCSDGAEAACPRSRPARSPEPAANTPAALAPADNRNVRAWKAQV